MPVIARPNLETLSRWDDAVPAGSILRVGRGESAVLVYGGKELAVLREGDVVLSAATLPVLAPAIEGDDVEAELWFVGGEPRDQTFAVGAAVADPGSSLRGQGKAAGTLRLRVSSPERAVLACIDDGPEALAGKLQAAIEPVIADSLSRVPLRALAAAASAELANGIASACGPAVASLGFEVVGASSVMFSLDAATREALAKAAPPAAGGAATCSKCGASPVSGKFCPNCGNPLAVGPPTCSGCGQALTPGARFCGGCGAPQP